MLVPGVVGQIRYRLVLAIVGRTRASTASGWSENTAGTAVAAPIPSENQVMDEEPSITRRLAAILAADIAGYSWLRARRRWL